MIGNLFLLDIPPGHLTGSGTPYGFSDGARPVQDCRRRDVRLNGQPAQTGSDRPQPARRVAVSVRTFGNLGRPRPRRGQGIKRRPGSRLLRDKDGKSQPAAFGL